MKKKIGFFLFLNVNIILNAQQNCGQSPAPCPDKTSIDQTMNVANRTKDNDAYQQQLQMESQVRQLATDEVERIATVNGWSVYELTEDGMDRPPYIYISYSDWEATPFNKRPPDRYQVSFIFITNKDSLQAWRDYLQNNVQKEGDQLVQQYSESQSSNPLLQQYADSVTYYSSLMSDFIQKEFPTYQKALIDKDQQAINSYERRQKALQQKSDYFTKKIQDIQSGGTRSFKDAQAEWAKQIVDFAEGSIALVHFDINPYSAGLALDNVEENNLSQHSISVPGAFHASVTKNNTKPDLHSYTVGTYNFTFQNPSYVATILFGSYLPKTNNNNFPAAFTKSFHDKESVIGSTKVVTCEKIQNIQLHIQGGRHSVDAILNALDWQKLNALMYK